MTDLTAGPPSVDQIRADYAEMTRRKRVYGGILLIVFVALMAAGFRTADDRNAGSFIDGWHRILDYPAEVLSEAWEKIGAMPENLVKFFPALVETLNIAAASTLIGTIVGTFLALMSTRGMALWPALIPLFRRISDIFRAIPEIVIALVLIFILGGGPVPAMIAIAIVFQPHYVRLTRASVLSERQKDYVTSARVAGAGKARLMFKTVLPNCLAPIIVQAALSFSTAILDAAALGFLGMGAQPPTPEWGTMLAEAREFILRAWWVVTFPGLAILVTVLAINLMGDGLRDALDPKDR